MNVIGMLFVLRTAGKLVLQKLREHPDIEVKGLVR